MSDTRSFAKSSRTKSSRRRKGRRADKPDAGPQAILVLGMHRSGTSALTRVFNFLGADLPKSLMGGGVGNELGHWEPLDLVNLHDEMLGSMGSNWHDWRAIDPDWNESSAAEPFKARLLAGLRSDYGDTPLFVVKDPRICRFVPVWREVLERHGARPQAVMILRNPLEVAASLRDRDGFLAAKSLLLWLRHALDAERDTRDLPRAVVTYDRLIKDWRAVADDVAAKTEIRWPRRSDHAELEIERFLSGEHRHHAVDPADLSTRRAIVDWVTKAHTSLVAMSNGQDNSAHQRNLDGIRRAFDKAASAFGLVLADESERAGQLQEEAARLREREAQLAQERDQTSAALQDARGTLARASEDVARLNAAVAGAVAAGRQHEQQAAQLTRDLDGARRLLRDSQTEVQRLAGDLDGTKGEVARISAKLQEKEAQLDQAAVELAAVRVENQFARANFDRAAREMAEQDAETASLRRTLDAAQAEIKMARDEAERQAAGFARALKDAHAAAERERDEAARVSSILSATRKTVHDTQIELQQLKSALGDADRRRSADAARVAELTREAGAAAEQAQKARRDLDDLRRAQEETRSRRWRARLARVFSRGRRGGAALRREVELIRASRLFDALWYLKRYPDVAAAGVDPLEHYIRYGSGEGRDPHPLFDNKWYVGQAGGLAADLAASGLSALGHYASLGVGRGLDPNPLFDTDWYLAQNPAVAAAGLNPLQHFWKEGAARGLDPHPLFDTSWYLERNLDVARSGDNALLHYLEHGKREGREAQPVTRINFAAKTNESSSNR